MKASSAKQKGRKLQQDVKDKILKAFPTLEEDDVKSTSMGAPGEDVQLSPAARRLFPYSVECKSRTSIAVYAWYQQAKANAPKGSTPLLVIKQNHSKPLVLVDLDTFMGLVK
ncbi:hypothetical protein EKK58_08275 [Candidatus Dependentiae bacterium]|nr:MAG: hypothetical protein EKK58_08275 [Candidatus Dependentiae bacterium]